MCECIYTSIPKSFKIRTNKTWSSYSWGLIVSEILSLIRFDLASLSNPSKKKRRILFPLTFNLLPKWSLWIRFRFPRAVILPPKELTLSSLNIRSTRHHLRLSYTFRIKIADQEISFIYSQQFDPSPLARCHNLERIKIYLLSQSARPWGCPWSGWLVTLSFRLY